jgi:DNA-binding NarL/FixJ family response regulator
MAKAVAAGRTNPDIAATLHLSLPTVKGHVAQILRKTGAENRAAATAFAIRHRLA